MGTPLKWGTQHQSMYSPMGGGVGQGVRGCPIGGLKCPIGSLRGREICHPSPITERIGHSPLNRAHSAI